MSNGRILIVEDDFDISNMLKIFFSGQGYSVEVAARGTEALDLCRKKLPDLIVLDIMLPDMDGYAVCRQLRTTTRTGHIPIIFLTQRDERSDRIAGLELGADDYITKPFDIEELKLRVRTAINTHKRLNLTDPITALPSSRLIEDQLRGLIRVENWTYMEIGVDHLNAFKDAYGFVANDEVLRFTAMLLNELDDQLGTLDDFIGHASSNTFVLITLAENVQPLVEQLRQRFDEGILAHYGFMDREQGGISLSDGRIEPIMRLSIGLVSDTTQSFSDIREITETAAELRRLDQIENS
ncbi:MAG: response regulator [Chloroflexi bacterium]|nr:MAG: response regulator [Chloroflexota bacterium]